MATKRKLTLRERVIATLTVIAIIGAGVYYGFLESFIEDYTITVADIEVAQKDLARQRESLARAPQINAEFESIGQIVLEPQADKTLPQIFTENVNSLCKGMAEITPPEFEAVPQAEDFAYIVISVPNLEGDLQTLAEMLKSFNNSDLLVRDLDISVSGGLFARSRNLKMTVDLAQLVRKDDLEEANRLYVEEEYDKLESRLKAAKKK